MRGLFGARGFEDAVALPPGGMTLQLTRRETGRTLQTLVALAIVPVAISAAWLALASDHLERPLATALYRSYLAAAPMLIGLYWWRRRPASRFGPLLIVFGITAWIVSWQSSDWPLAFDLGVLAEAPGVVLTFYLFLAFPSGYLESAADRALVGAWTVVMFGFYIPWALASPVIAGAGPLTSCVPACPDNVLQIGSAPRLVEVLGRWEIYLLLVLTVAVLVVYAARLSAASRPRRRALIAVAVTSLLFLPVFFTFHFSRQVLKLDPDTLQTMSWGVVGARVLLPLGFLVALVQADLFAGAARANLLRELITRPSPERWRDVVALALDDPGLRMAYWDTTSYRYLEPGGNELTTQAGPNRTWVEADRDGRPVAAMHIDRALAEDPELVQVATSATVLAIEHGRLEGELLESQARIIAAGDAERHRIERDLHDSAQQRLVALRIHVALASERLYVAEQRDMVDQLGAEVEEAIDDLRSIATGAYPDVLRQAGTAAALRSVSRYAAIPVSIDDQLSSRHPEAIELAVYFCCLEALQNAAKHAGPGSVASVRLSQDDGYLSFTVEDDGTGFASGRVKRGAGLNNMADRVSTAGGTLHIASAVGRGTQVTGRLPI
jgi:signal transduction histidine kinase